MNVAVQLLLFASFLLGVLTEEDTNCLDNNISPDDEDVSPGDYDDNDTIMTAFLRKLEKYTGLPSIGPSEPSEPFSVTLNNCGGRVCVINPNGTAVWDARMDLYRNNMMVETNEKTTFDGCLCYSKDPTEYRSCMTDVRNNMIKQLDTIFVEKFRAIVESDCNTFIDNCKIIAE